MCIKGIEVLSVYLGYKVYKVYPGAFCVFRYLGYKVCKGY